MGSLNLNRSKPMPPHVTEIAADVFRISTFHPEFGIQFNQFLIADDEPFLMHTGMKKMFSTTLEGVSSVIDCSFWPRRMCRTVGTQDYFSKPSSASCYAPTFFFNPATRGH